MNVAFSIEAFRDAATSVHWFCVKALTNSSDMNYFTYVTKRHSAVPVHVSGPDAQRRRKISGCLAVLGLCF